MQDIKIQDQSPHCSKHVLPAVPSSEVYLEDCVKALKRYADNHFDLAIVDPPYGIGAENHAGNVDNGWKQWTKKSWDSSIPDAEYFEQLFRVSKNQIIWGGNYFASLLPNSQGWIFWDKGQRNFSLADGELAFTSFEKALRVYTLNRVQLQVEGETFHPTQKPIKLYDFCFDFAKVEAGMKVLDTHLGSQSSRISANKYQLNFVGFETDEEYFNKGNKRYDDFISQTRMF